MTIYIFRRLIGKTRGWGVYRVDDKGRQALVESYETAPEAKRHTDRLRHNVIG